MYKQFLYQPNNFFCTSQNMYKFFVPTKQHFCTILNSLGSTETRGRKKFSFDKWVLKASTQVMQKENESMPLKGADKRD